MEFDLGAPKRKRGRPKGSKNSVRNRAGVPTGKKTMEYQGQQEAYFKVVGNGQTVWYTDGYLALMAFEQTKDGALYCGRKTSQMLRVR